jgi:thiosulfate/3-mercaptopyruvate sulfurtransferase
VFTLFGHPDTRLMDGGRQKWVSEGRSVSTAVPERAPTSYPVVKRADGPVRAFRDQVFRHYDRGGRLVDVRSPQEFRGELLHMPDYPQEGALRGGHIPGAASVPWKRAANDDGTFKSADELRAIYVDEIGLKPEEEVIAYCRIGERSSHTWFVLTHLLGFSRVRNYDGSWTEWGNLVGAPIEK